MASNYNSTDGSISQWNEGNFKTLRLHEAQEMINSGKISPFNISPDGYTWNYKIWVAGIDILYEEGYSKYSSEEIEEVENIRSFVEKIIELKPAFKNIIEVKYDGKHGKFIPIKKNQDDIKMLIRMYEKIVKRLNDEHGLSTRNIDADLRGL